MFSTSAECEHITRLCTNPRYKNFFQTYFTAGDEEQFIERIKGKPIEPNSFPEFSYQEFWHGYKDINGKTIVDTYRYISNKFKKGIFISIRNNKLDVFLPFSKAKFINEWSHKIKQDPSRFETLIDFFKHTSQLENRPFSESRINKFTSRWYANNCLVRCEFPLSEGDTGTHHLISMFEALCESRKLPDCDLFVNRRDFPLLKRDYTEPYDHMWDSESTPLVSHKYDKYVPILSPVSTSEFADIAMPTIEDWARVKFAEGYFFPKTHKRDYSDTFTCAWNDKIPIAVFRGASTGAGVTIDTNQRLKVAYLSSLLENKGLLDAGITDWNLRPRKIKGNPYLQTIEIDKLPFGLVKKLSPEEQSKYKYIIHIDGHTAAFRLSLEMAMGSVILKVDSKYKLWFFDMLIPYVHYVPVKGDLSDLIDKVKWCRENDEKCRDIAKAARLFYDTNLTEDGLFDYMQKLLCQLHHWTGIYSYPQSPLSVQLNFQSESIIRKNVSFRDKTLIYSNKLSKIFCNSEYTKVIKETCIAEKVRENIHEAFIGTLVLNNLRSPHLATIHGLDNFNSVITEYIPGKTLFAWIESNAFSFKELLRIIAQLCLGLYQIQQQCGFVHNDLFPWNIMLKQLPKEETFTYVLSPEKVVTIKTDVVPIMIDYGKSHVIHNKSHFGFINMFRFDAMIDPLCLLFSTINCVIKAKAISKAQDKLLIDVMNFVSNTSICTTPFTTFSQVRQFILDNSNFTSICSLDTSCFKRQNPVSLFDHINAVCPLATVSTSLTINSVLTTHTQKQLAKKVAECDYEDRLAVYFFFQYLSRYKYGDLFETEFKEKISKSQFSQNYDYTPLVSFARASDYDYLEPSFSIPDLDWSNFHFEMLNYVLAYRGVYELSKFDRLGLQEKLNQN